MKGKTRDYVRGKEERRKQIFKECFSRKVTFRLRSKVYEATSQERGERIALQTDQHKQRPSQVRLSRV